MRNVSKTILTLMALIALGLTSCTKDDGKDAGSDPNAIQKTTVLANINTNQPSTSLTGKDVNRGSIYAWVSSIDVTAASSVWSYSTNEHFDLVSSGGASNFTIENVALGLNNFVASTATNVSPIKLLATTTGDPAAVRTALTAHYPYALYTGSKSASISNTGINTVDFNMTTQHGRIISIFSFQNDPILRANTKAKITVKIDGVPYATSELFSNTDLVTFEWSNAESTAGKEVRYEISIYDVNNQLVVTYPVVDPVKIKASTSISCIYEINRERVISSFPTELTFTWQQWKNEECENDYSNDGYNCLGYDREGNNRLGFNKCGWHKAPEVFYNPTQDQDLSDGDSNAKCGGN